MAPRERISRSADKWLHGLYKAIDTLQTRPLRCPFAAESHKFPEELHELLYGKRGKRTHEVSPPKNQKAIGRILPSITWKRV
jgi:hypothetical protein